MALYSVLRRASSSVLPLAARAVGSPRSFHGAISAVRSLQNGNLRSDLARRSFAPFHQFSRTLKSGVEEDLLSIIDSEINCAEEIEGQNFVDEIPEGFPFEIEDNQGERTIFLTRKFDGETIEVEVDIPNLSVEDEDEGEGEGEDDANTQESADNNSIPLVVSISKGSGLQLEFGVTAFTDSFIIDSLSIKKPKGSEEQLVYEGPEFNDLDENFQKAFYNYLEARGINQSTLGFFHKYMVAKESKEYMNWLKNLKDFVEH